MHRQTIKILGRITTITLIILVLLSVANAFLDESDSLDENKYNFKSASSSELGNVWVAVSTNIGIRFQEKSRTISGAGWAIALWELSGDALLDRDQILSVNILALRDYSNLLSTDVKELLSTSSNKEAALSWYISQLEIRYKNGVQNWVALTGQEEKLNADKIAALAAVEKHKAEMLTGLEANDADAISIAMDSYLIETNNYNIANSNLVFVRYFIKKYAAASEYNKTLLDTLINNKEALSNGSFVVVPDSWEELLRDLNLLYDEAEYKENR